MHQNLSFGCVRNCSTTRYFFCLSAFIWTRVSLAIHHSLFIASAVWFSLTASLFYHRTTKTQQLWQSQTGHIRRRPLRKFQSTLGKLVQKRRGWICQTWSFDDTVSSAAPAVESVHGRLVFVRSFPVRFPSEGLGFRQNNDPMSTVLADCVHDPRIVDRPTSEQQWLCSIFQMSRMYPLV